MQVRFMPNLLWLRQAIPPQALHLGFPILTLIGAFLLTLPISAASRKGTSSLDVLRTSASATYVPGLIVPDTLHLFLKAGGLWFPLHGPGKHPETVLPRMSPIHWRHPEVAACRDATVRGSLLGRASGISGYAPSVVLRSPPAIDRGEKGSGNHASRAP